MRSAFTLVELLLVLALLVVGAAVASTSLSAGNERAKLRQAAEKLSIAWSDARLRAIDTGAPLVFRCRIGDAWGYVGTCDTPEASFAAAVESESAGALSTLEELRLADEGETDDRVVFQQLLVAERPGSPAIGAGVREGDLSAMVVFYPDGATSDAESMLATSGGQTLRVTLRGLTGSTRVTDPLDDATPVGGP